MATWEEIDAFEAKTKNLEQYDWSGGDYEWSTAQIATLNDGTHWIRAGSGCSCDWINDVEWEPLRDMNQVHSMLDDLLYETKDLPRKAEMIKYAQGLLGGK